MSNAEKVKIMRNVFVPSKSYVFPVTVKHFKYDCLGSVTLLLNMVLTVSTVSKGT